VDSSDWGLVREAAANRPTQVEIVVNGCAYSCCGRGWRRRDGYEQTYRGWVDNFNERDGELAGTFMLYSPGLGSLSYVVAVRDFELLDACPT
jgi:hypothetical protein